MKPSSKNLASGNRRHLKAISEFANMGDSPQNWLAFNNRWPELFPTDLYVDSESEIRRNVKRAKHPVDSPMVESFDLTHYGVKTRYWTRRTEEGQLVDYEEPRILRLRNLVREAWAGGQNANQCVDELLALRLPPGESPDVWSPPVSADWRRGSLVFRARNPFQAACYALLLKSNLARFCANPDCPAPYFVATRATQRYCSQDCLKPAQKQWKLDWWNREGKTRRAKASGKSRKERRKNGSRKTR
jgi:hypothetical protein